MDFVVGRDSGFLMGATLRSCLCSCVELSRCRQNVFGIVGENFTFPVKIDQSPLEILWTKNKNKVAEWEGQNKTIYFTSLRNRGLLNKENGCLTIFNLENNDAGTYVLKYLDSVHKDWNLNFILAVLANFQKPLKYAWKFSSSPDLTHQTQEVSVPKNVDASEKATCFIKFSQTEKSSEISLTECFPDKKGNEWVCIDLVRFLLTSQEVEFKE
uniref:Lymphocyte function-associated antigen 3 n=1 Tax=Calidris pygmaea TaxID=425635 RepID=A0A8C3JXT6_9CHAR